MCKVPPPDPQEADTGGRMVLVIPDLQMRTQTLSMQPLCAELGPQRGWPGRSGTSVTEAPPFMEAVLCPFVKGGYSHVKAQKEQVWGGGSSLTGRSHGSARHTANGSPAALSARAPAHTRVHTHSRSLVE